MTKQSYDVIGDVHGEAKKLEGLLSALGYSSSEGVWSHPERIAVFVGDLIDGGSSQLATVDIVRPMVKSGAAHCVLGNHEFNAIAWATPDPDAPGEYLRRRDHSRHRKQHCAFLAEVENGPRHEEVVVWFKTLPLWLDFGEFRVVHACWHDASISALKPHLGPTNTLTDDLIVQANRKGHSAFEAIETVCKGLEIDLPEGQWFTDAHGHRRRSARLKWWALDPASLRNSVLLPENALEGFPEVPLPKNPRLEAYDGPPVFFGHYWRTGAPGVDGGKYACVDYSAVKGGPLVAYRWDGEQELKDNRFVCYGGA